jgi:hypothetical protein
MDYYSKDVPGKPRLLKGHMGIYVYPLSYSNILRGCRGISAITIIMC